MDVAWLGTMLLVLISCILIFSNWKTLCQKRNLPPGPTPLPLIGNLMNINKGQLVSSLMKLWEQYGAVYTLYFGTQPIVVLCGYDVVNEALVNQAEDFGARGKMTTFDKVSQGYGISFSNGERWRQMRHFTLKTLRNYGMGKKSIEQKIQEEAHFLAEEFRKSGEIPIDLSKHLMDAVSNILCSIMFGNRFEYNNESFTVLLAKVDEMFNLMSDTWSQVETILPNLMAYIPGPHKKRNALEEELISFLHNKVKANQETFDPSYSRDFIDEFLIKIEQEKNNSNSEFTMRNTLLTFFSLFLGGTETSTTTLKHGLLLMIKYPDIQAKLHMEIDRVVGRDRMANMSDHNAMPYMEAVINEIQRFSDIIPMNAPRKVTKDVQFRLRGYTIPEGTKIYPLLCTVHRDPKYFCTPYTFNPSHFLDEQGRFRRNDAMMAFSAGKRICPGKSLTRMELFLFFSTILQNFTLTSPTHFTEDDVAPKMTGFLNHPIKYKVSFIAR
ncbi:cytochrome P450 2G1 [Xenopus laevis]|uniref:Uncharacterized protein n=2 Tax=Xenopus laevis TaxID=8355 RepID=A0A974C7L7_XENLA|nr:cytochrome P450 2G1 [Xenopus laevis]OCT68033.1 hypothetical protein XELAEV_18039329mg [Xenopus laevis]